MKLRLCVIHLQKMLHICRKFWQTDWPTDTDKARSEAPSPQLEKHSTTKFNYPPYFLMKICWSIWTNRMIDFCKRFSGLVNLRSIAWLESLNFDFARRRPDSNGNLPNSFKTLIRQKVMQSSFKTPLKKVEKMRIWKRAFNFQIISGPCTMIISS